MQYLYEDTTAAPTKKKNKNRRRNKAKHQVKETVWMVNTIDSELDHLLPSPYLTKLGDPGVTTIDCMIEGSTFYKTLCDIGSSTNIMSKVTYKHLYNTRPMYHTYVQLQMADQSFQRLEGVVKDVMVKIRDHYVPTDFMVLDMGEEDYVHLILG
jgi:GTP1/Obg family GTP-binding protein